MSKLTKLSEENVLTLEGDGETLFAGTSFEKLSEAVDYWSKKNPNVTLSWREWNPNNIAEAVHWEWAYIAPTADMTTLENSGGTVPPKRTWGTNLVKSPW